MRISEKHTYSDLLAVHVEIMQGLRPGKSGRALGDEWYGS